MKWLHFKVERSEILVTAKAYRSTVRRRRPSSFVVFAQIAQVALEARGVQTRKP